MFAFEAEAQALSVEDARARYVIEVCKHVDWPGDGLPERFEIAVVSSERATRRAFERLGKLRVKDRTVRIRYFSEVDFEPSEFSVIYLDSKFRGINDSLFATVPGTLLVVNGNVSRELQMISLAEESGQVSIHLNRENLIRFGFTPSIALLEFAGSREDLTEELRQKQSRLQSVLDQVNDKERQLEELDRQLEHNAASMAGAREALSKSDEELSATREQLSSLSEDINQAQAEMEKYRVQIAERQARFETTQRELLRNEASIRERERIIAELESDIGKSRAVLERQLAEIEGQRELLERKNETISAQRGSMLAISAALLVFLLLAFFLLRLNALRTRSNLKLEKLNNQLYELATTDSLTGLFNRRQFLNTANDAFHYQRSMDADMAILMLDIDEFKRINDQYGHAAGDLVIKSVGETLGHNLRDFDILGRLGGEEYAMLLVGCDGNEALEVGRRLCRDIAAMTVTHQNHRIQVTISIGVAQLCKQDVDIEPALSRADKALYEAKGQGRNQVVGFADK